MKSATKNPIERNLARFEREIAPLLRNLKSQIDDDYRCSDDPEDNTPGMLVTVSTDNEASTWHYQTGDNSYSGGCYGDPHWAVIYLYRRSNCATLAKDACNELAEGIRSAEENKRWHASNAAQGEAVS